jgi:protein TonB
VFTKMIFPVTGFHLLENNPAPVLKNINYGGDMRFSERPWLALGLVVCAHLAVFAALRPQPESLPIETPPEPIMISLVSAPQATPEKPMPAAQPVAMEQKPVKKKVKPVTKPVIPLVKQTSQPVAPPVEQTSTPVATTDSPVAEQQAKATNSKAADTQTYQSPNFNAAYLNNPAPNYPAISRRLGEEGLVLLQVQVTADGKAGSVELQTGSGSDRLNEAALEAVKKWRFVPAKRGDQAVSASVVVPVRFSIEEG